MASALKVVSVSLWGGFITGAQESNSANVCGMSNYHTEQQETASATRRAEITKESSFSPKREARGVKRKCSVYNCRPHKPEESFLTYEAPLPPADRRRKKPLEVGNEL